MIQCRFFVINGESYLHFLSENWFFFISQIGAPLYEMLHLELLKHIFFANHVNPKVFKLWHFPDCC